jgi:MSHA biogenesis protein MshM
MQYYLSHRLVIAGYQGSRMFSSAAMTLMYLKSKGVPRLVNILAHKALLATYGKGKYQVGFREVLAAAADTKSIVSIWRKIPLYTFSLTGLLAVCASAFLVYAK